MNYIPSKLRTIIWLLLRNHKDLVIRIINFLYNYINPCDGLSLSPENFALKIIDKQYAANVKYPSYAIITPVLNEEQNIVKMLESIENQILKPKEVIIVDGGSKDKTIEKIKNFKTHSKLNIKLLTSKVKNIGHQRNIAIDNATCELLVNVDAGTTLDKYYAVNVIGPFVEDDKIELVSGVHYPKEKYKWSKMFSPEEHFKYNQSPYGACLVYKKKLALKAGRFPEYLTYAGEDTLFIYKYKKLSKRWVFNKKAFILWEHPSTMELAWKKQFDYTKANFEIGLWPYFYSQYIFLANSFSGLLHKQGFLWMLKNNLNNFLKNQAAIEVIKRKIKGVCFVFAQETFESNKSIEARKIAADFIKKNYKVIFINSNSPKTEIKNKKYYNLDHTLLEPIHYKSFRIHHYLERYGKEILDKSICLMTHEPNDLGRLIRSITDCSKSLKIIHSKDLPK